MRTTHQAGQRQAVEFLDQEGQPLFAVHIEGDTLTVRPASTDPWRGDALMTHTLMLKASASNQIHVERELFTPPEQDEHPIPDQP